MWFTCESKQVVIELGHTNRETGPTANASSSTFTQLKALVCESVGAVRHEVSVPFHDSQVRGTALLIQTGWDRFWDTEAYWEPGPYLAEHLIFRMIRSGVKLVGVDFPVAGRSSATRLITSGQIPIVENLRGLNSLPRVGFRFSAVPTGSSEPVRTVHAYADIA
jgi:kynurenine formamidase